MIKDEPWWAPRTVPPKGAPNALLIITYDAGFGVPSTFSGVIPTPTMDRIANEGLRAGVQVEITRGLRDALLARPQGLIEFANAVRRAIA